MRFNIVNLGCKVNRVESDDIAARLLAAGFSYDTKDPKIVIVNTCTVTGEAEKKTRKTIRRVVRTYPQAQILVTGCAAAIDPDQFTSMDPRVQVVEKPHVCDRCCHLAHTDMLPSHAIPSLRVGDSFPTRVGIKVQDGCNRSCTYCIVHTARGRETSTPVAHVCETARVQTQAGARELILTGINLGAYRNVDTTGTFCDLADLVALLRQACPEARLRISSIEPVDVTEKLIDLLATEDGMVCRHLHLPLQSGSSRVLSAMARPYTAEDFCALVSRLYERIPQMSLSTDIICGFPGETDEDFRKTLAVAKACRFSKIHVFRYSKRKGTPAATRDDQVPQEIITGRAHALQKLAATLRLEQARLRIGTTERILVQSDGHATTESYYPVHTETLPVGLLITATLTSLDKDGIFYL